MADYENKRGKNMKCDNCGKELFVSEYLIKLERIKKRKQN